MAAIDPLMEHLGEPSLPTFSSDLAIRGDRYPNDRLSWISSFYTYFQKTILKTLKLLSDPSALLHSLNIFMQLRVGCFICDTSSAEILSDLHILLIGF